MTETKGIWCEASKARLISRKPFLRLNVSEPMNGVVSSQKRRVIYRPQKTCSYEHLLDLNQSFFAEIHISDGLQN